MTDSDIRLLIDEIGDRFKDILDGDVVAIFKMLRSAYDTLEEWKNSREDEDD